MKYRLKKTSAEFEMVDGPLAGRKYLRGKLYAEIPPALSNRFETVEAPAAAKPEAAEPAPRAEGGKKK